MVRKRATQPKLIERLFSRWVASQFADQIRKFRGWIHEERWGTVAFSIPEIRKLQVAFRWCWGKVRFMRGIEDGDPAAGDFTQLANDVDRAVTSNLWWAWQTMTDHLCEILREATRWNESCSCHYHLVTDPTLDVPALLRATWEKCPMRGLRYTSSLA